MNTIQNELYHEGVKGMKWGVRHGPPYPLARGGRKLSSLLVKSRDPEKMAAKAKARQERKEARAERRTQRAIERAENRERKRKRDIRMGKVSVKDLSDDELKYAIERLKAEDDYLTRLGKETPAQILKNKKEKEIDLVNSVLKDVGKNAIAPLASGLVTDYFYRKLMGNNKQGKDPESESTMGYIFKTFFNSSEEGGGIYSDILNVLSKTDGFGKGMQDAAKQYAARQQLRDTIKDDDLFDELDTMLTAFYNEQQLSNKKNKKYDSVSERAKRITNRMNAKPK